MKKNWFVLSVKSNYEKRIAKNLASLGIDVFCPMFKEVRQWSDRKKEIEVPFFRSYVFVRLHERERNLVFSVPYVIRYVFWLGKPAIVKEEEIENLKYWLGHKGIVDYEIVTYESGQKINLSIGSLKHQKAIVQQANKNRVRLIVEGLGIIVNIKVHNLT